MFNKLYLAFFKLFLEQLLKNSQIFQEKMSVCLKILFVSLFFFFPVFFSYAELCPQLDFKVEDGKVVESYIGEYECNPQKPLRPPKKDERICFFDCDAARAPLRKKPAPIPYMPYPRGGEIDDESQEESGTTNGGDNQTVPSSEGYGGYGVNPYHSQKGHPLESFREESDNQMRQAEEQHRQLIEREQLRQSYIDQELNKVKDNLLSPLKKEIDEILFSEKITDEVKLQKAYEFVRRIIPSVKDYVENYTGLPHTRGNYSERAIAEGIGILQSHTMNKLFAFRSEILHREKETQLKDLFTNKDSEWNRKTVQITSETERDIRDMFDDLERIFFSSDKDKYTEYNKEEIVQTTAFEIEENLYKTAKILMNEDLGASLSALRTNIDPLYSLTDTSFQLAEHIQMNSVLSEYSSSAYYEKNIEDMTLNILKSTYDRKNLGLLEETNLPQTDEELYPFQSPEGEFLNRLKVLHSKLYSARPFHEQGVQAREIGLLTVQIADREYAEGNKEKAEMALLMGETMSDIAIGLLLPTVGFGKDVYELFTGKHLLTGRTLNDFERTMSLIGVCTFGAMNSGTIKLVKSSVKKVGDLADDLAKLLNTKVTKKLSDQTGLSRKSKRKLQKMRDHEAVLESLDKIGIESPEEIEMARRFLQKVFTKRDPHLEEVIEVIESVGKKGIKNYTKVIDKLKDHGMSLTFKQERKLAVLLREQGQSLSEADLLKQVVEIIGETSPALKEFLSGLKFDGNPPRKIVKEAISKIKGIEKEGFLFLQKLTRGADFKKLKSGEGWTIRLNDEYRLTFLIEEEVNKTVKFVNFKVVHKSSDIYK